MNDATLVVVVSAVIAAIPTTIGSITAAFLAFAAWRTGIENGQKADTAALATRAIGAKADTVIEKTTEIHTLANGNLTEATAKLASASAQLTEQAAALATAHATIQGLHQLIAQALDTKHDTAIATATILAAAKAAPAVTDPA